MEYQTKETRTWKAPDAAERAAAFASFQRTVYEVSVGIQVAQGAVPRMQLDRALGQLGYDRCEDCTAETDYALHALEAGGHIETYLRVR